MGYEVASWVQAFCVIPDREFRGEPFRLTDEQLRFLCYVYALTPEGRWVHQRGAQLVRPQKWGKGPLAAALVCAEAAGPARFAGWDAAGEPVGKPWATPHIQITACSEEQTANTWRALQPMIELGPLRDWIPDSGLTRINLHGGGIIEPVTASARSRLGQRITFVVQDQALALDTPLPTPTGWTTMGEVETGDWLLGSNGRPAVVTQAKPIQRDHDCYRVVFADDTSVVASAGHLWLTRVCASAARPCVRTTAQMVADGRRFRIPAPRPYRLPKRSLPIDPYVLGLWLGDGKTGAPSISVGDEDADETQHQLAAVGWQSKVQRYGGRAPSLALSAAVGYQASGRPAHVKALQALLCYRDKHVPDEYLRASIAQRTALLQGLMDSDGYVSPGGQCAFVGSERLSADLLALLRTLGQVARRVWRAREDYTAGGIWKVNFTPRGRLQPFRLGRKARRVRPARRGPKWVTIARIERVSSVPVRCVEVASPDHLFLAGEAGHVTHNTESWVQSNNGWWLADNQRRNLAGMGGRFLETCNAPDPVEQSVAQRTPVEPGVYIDDVDGGPGSVRNKAERRKVLRRVYGDVTTDKGGWVDLDRIDAEIEALLEHDPAQAERFFLNRKLAAEGAAFDPQHWQSLARPRRVPYGAVIAIGVDGARHLDALAVVATEVTTGYQWPLIIIERPPHAPDEYEHDLEAVDGAVAQAMDDYLVWRLYADDQYIAPLIERWQNRFGQRRVVVWHTNRPRPIAWAVRAYEEAVAAGDLSHDGDETFTAHIRQARRRRLTVLDDKERQMHTLSKDSIGSQRKIDAAMAAVLSWEARSDCVAAGAVDMGPPPEPEPTPRPPDRYEPNHAPAALALAMTGTLNAGPMPD